MRLKHRLKVDKILSRIFFIISSAFLSALPPVWRQSKIVYSLPDGWKIKMLFRKKCRRSYTQRNSTGNTRKKTTSEISVGNKKLFIKSNRQNNFLDRASGEQLHRELYGKKVRALSPAWAFVNNREKQYEKIPFRFFMLMKLGRRCALTRKVS